MDPRAQIRRAPLPVIALTAQHGASEEKALDLGAQDYLTKPVRTRSLIARERAVLKRVSAWPVNYFCRSERPATGPATAARQRSLAHFLPAGG